MKTLIIRLEENMAVCRKKNKSILEIDRALLPFGVKDGDILNIEGSVITIDQRETDRNREKIKSLIDDIF